MAGKFTHHILKLYQVMKGKTTLEQKLPIMLIFLNNTGIFK